METSSRQGGWRGRILARRRFIYSERRRKMGLKDENNNIILIDERLGRHYPYQDTPENDRLKKFGVDERKHSEKGIRCSGKDMLNQKLLMQTGKNVKNFDRGSLLGLLKNKEVAVGSMVLVDGRPAVIKKRQVGRAGEMLRQYTVWSVKNCRQELATQTRIRNNGG